MRRAIASRNRDYGRRSSRSRNRRRRRRITLNGRILHVGDVLNSPVTMGFEASDFAPAIEIEIALEGFEWFRKEKIVRGFEGFGFGI